MALPSSVLLVGDVFDRAYEYHSGMARDDLNVLSAFLAVAEERSFTKAAKRLNVSQSALSHAVRGLEEEIGVRLLARTTRSVAPTDAGEELLRSLRPALSDIRAALGKISGRRDKPAGRVRLVVSPLAAGSVLGPKLGEFARNYPDVVLDITTDESRVDLVAGGYDAGIHYGEFIEQDMVAVRVSPDHRPAIVGSSVYFDSHPRPKSPRDLLQHRCINFRHDRDVMVQRRRIDVEVQAVFILRAAGENYLLRATRRERGRVAYSAPLFGRLRCPPPQTTGRRGGVR